MTESWSTRRTRPPPPPYDPFQPLSSLPKPDSGLVHLAAERGRMQANVSHLSEQLGSVSRTLYHGDAQAPSVLVQLSALNKDIANLRTDLARISDVTDENFKIMNQQLSQQFASINSKLTDIQYKQENGVTKQDKDASKRQWELWIKLVGLLTSIATIAGLLLKTVVS